MTRGQNEWLACCLGLCLVGANVVVKPGLDRGVVSRASDAARRSREWRGRVAPPFDTPLVDGGTYRASEHRGQPATIVVFFTTWCGTCADELQALQDYSDSQRTRGKRVGIIAINGQETQTVVARFVANADVTVPTGLDADGTIARAYEITTFPTTVVVGADGRVRLYHEGPLLNPEVVIDPIVQDEFARPSQS